MSAVEQYLPDALFTESERAWLVRYCATLSGRPEQAEDLAQETLVEAWRNRHKLVDQTGRLPWLAAIARNVVQRWFRQQGRDHQHLVSLDESEEPGESARLQSPVDFEHDLERAELATLLDRALALLPAETRLALIAHYVEELPQAEIAAKLGMTTGTLAVRLHRGKLALRRLFATDLRQDALDYGLGVASGARWQEMPLWCPYCGQHRLQGRFDQEEGHLLIRCPFCLPVPIIDHATPALDGVTNCRAALYRVLDWLGEYFPPALQAGSARCFRCGKLAPLRAGMPFAQLSAELRETGFHVACSCQAQNNCSLSNLALVLPEGRQFLKAHPRIRLLPLDEREVDGVPAVVATFVSVTKSARFEVAAARDSFGLLSVHATS